VKKERKKERNKQRKEDRRKKGIDKPQPVTEAFLARRRGHTGAVARKL
jgi:hypothetical protein